MHITVDYFLRQNLNHEANLDSFLNFTRVYIKNIFVHMKSIENFTNKFFAQIVTWFQEKRKIIGHFPFPLQYLRMLFFRLTNFIAKLEITFVIQKNCKYLHSVLTELSEMAYYFNSNFRLAWLHMTNHCNLLRYTSNYICLWTMVSFFVGFTVWKTRVQPQNHWRESTCSGCLYDFGSSSHFSSHRIVADFWDRLINKVWYKKILKFWWDILEENSNKWKIVWLGSNFEIFSQNAFWRNIKIYFSSKNISSKLW